MPPPSARQRTPNLQAEAAFQAGWFEIQDEGSQIAALLSGAGPRKQVLDLCAGAGGKTLALAALMQNTGQLYAYDADRNQLKPIFERIKRAGVRNRAGAASRRRSRRSKLWVPGSTSLWQMRRARVPALGGAARCEMAIEAGSAGARTAEQRTVLSARRHW